MFDMQEFVNRYAEPADLLAWAEDLMSYRLPDQTIEDHEKKPYMHRWYVLPRNPLQNVYLHRIVRSDKDVPHDHPWDNTSLVIDGSYREDTLLRDGSIRSTQYGPGDLIKRKAEDAHRLVLVPGEIVTTLFFCDKRRRDWGFHCPGGWVHWREFTFDGDRGRVGRGCGEMA